MLNFVSTALAQTEDLPITASDADAAAAVAIFGGAMAIIWIVVAVVGLVSLILWIWALVDCLKRQFPGSEKTTWIVVLIVSFFLGLGLIGAIIYLVAGKKKGTIAASAPITEEKK